MKLTQSFQTLVASSLLVAMMLFAVVLMTPPAQAQGVDRETLLERVAELQAQIQMLIEMIQQQETAEGGTNTSVITVGSPVQSTDRLKVRAAATTGGPLVTTVPPQTTGRVIGGPQTANGYTWWRVQYDNSVTGWSAGDWLVKVNTSVTGGETEDPTEHPVIEGDGFLPAEPTVPTNGPQSFEVKINGQPYQSASNLDRATAEQRCAALTRFNQSADVECLWGGQPLVSNGEDEVGDEEGQDDSDTNSDDDSSSNNDDQPNYTGGVIIRFEDGGSRRVGSEYTLTSAEAYCDEYAAENPNETFDCELDQENVPGADSFIFIKHYEGAGNTSGNSNQVDKTHTVTVQAGESGRVSLGEFHHGYRTTRTRALTLSCDYDRGISDSIDFVRKENSSGSPNLIYFVVETDLDVNADFCTYRVTVHNTNNSSQPVIHTAIIEVTINDSTGSAAVTEGDDNNDDLNTDSGSDSGGSGSTTTNTDRFLDHAYSCVLKKNPDSDGYAFWKDQMDNNNVSPSRVLNDMFTSSEYENKNRSDNAFLNDVYSCILFRNPDTAGKNFWMTYLENGGGRDYAVSQFLSSDDFQSINVYDEV